jgi:hypothetical protein
MLLLGKLVFRSKDEGFYEIPQLKILNEFQILRLYV